MLAEREQQRSADHEHQPVDGARAPDADSGRASHGVPVHTLRLTFDIDETVRDAQVELKRGLCTALAGGYYADTCWHGRTLVRFQPQLESVRPCITRWHDSLEYAHSEPPRRDRA